MYVEMERERGFGEVVGVSKGSKGCGRSAAI
jgi:hypothetical protein